MSERFPTRVEAGDNGNDGGGSNFEKTLIYCLLVLVIVIGTLYIFDNVVGDIGTPP